MKRNLLLGIILLLNTLSAIAQHSFVYNYDDRQFSSDVTWDVKISDCGIVYCTNGENLLMLVNGSFRILPFDSEIRCTYISDSLIYVGGVNELGYFETLNSGELRYVSLNSKLDNAVSNSLGNIWKIYEYDHAIYFITDIYVLKYINDKFIIINPELGINSSYMHSGALYVSGNGKIKYLVGQEFRDLQGCEILERKIIKGFASYQNKLLIVTEYDGIYIYDGEKLLPFVTDIDNLLKKYVVFCTADNEKNIAIGTIKGGLAIINKDDLSAEIINTSNGLKDNTIITLTFSKDGSLWAGLNNGISSIMLSYPIKSMYPYNILGAGTGMEETDEYVYLSTNQGVYFSQKSSSYNSQLETIKGLEGAAWRLVKAFGNVYCIHDRGIYRLEKDKAILCNGGNGFWGFVQLNDTVALATTYSEIYAINAKKNGKIDFYKIDQLGSFYNTAFDGKYIWLHEKGHNTCIKAQYVPFENKLSNVTLFTENDGLPNDKNFCIRTIDDKVYAISSNGVAVYNTSTNRFDIVDSIGGLDCRNGFLKIVKSGNFIAGLSLNCISFVNEKNRGVFYFDEQYVDPAFMSSELYLKNDSTLILATKKGFHIFNVNEFINQTDTSKVLMSVYIQDSLIWQSNCFNRKFKPEIPYKNANIKFVFGNQESTILYSYRLNSKENWSTPTSLSIKEFTSLYEGDYNFEIRKSNLNGKLIGYENFRFKVLPPWYRTWFAFVMYLLLLVLIIYLIFVSVRKHYHRKQSLIEEKNNEKIRQMEIQHEMETTANQLRISELEKQKLKDDYEYKTTELADMALTLSRKNEILTGLKNEIEKIVKSETLNPTLKSKIIGLNSMIDDNIQNDSLINRFEEQFNLLHNNFIRNLKSTYPQLSRNDYMLCVYVIMELSTKEIAQMLNMSVRGVESQKYRLKKKLALESTDLLTFLKDFEKVN